MEKKSLEAVREYTPDRFAKKVLFQQDSSTAFILNFLPGQALPPHKHPGHNLYLLVLEGAGTLMIDEAPTEVAAGDVIRSEGDELFSFRNTGTEPSRLYVVLVAAVR